MDFLNPNLSQNSGQFLSSKKNQNENNKICLADSSDKTNSQPSVLIIRQLINSDIPDVKNLADQNRSALGFLPLAKIIEASRDNRALVACKNDIVIGFVLFRHRKKDLQTTLSDICIDKDYRNLGIGRMLVYALLHDCRNMFRDFIQLKCPIDLTANIFYEKLGFSLYSIENGRKRKLNVWRLVVSSEPGEKIL